MFEFLPPELWTEILVRLPVRALLTLKCVSKTFLSLIQNPNFAYLHFSRFNNPNPNSDSNDSDLLLFNRATDSEYEVCRGNTSTKTLEFQIPANKYDRVMGYVDGLFWLHRFHSADAILCNPSIRKSLSIPLPLTLKGGPTDVGFGYDPVSEDYKAVVVVLPIPIRTRIALVEVYSLKLGSWRSFQVDHIPFVIDLRRNVYANGAIHWLAQNRLPEFSHLVSFDLGTEVFSYRQLPEENVEKDKDEPFEANVKLPVLFRGSFAVLYISRCHICVWVMTENDWNKECTIQSSSEFFQYLSVDCHGYCNNAVFCEKTGELVIAKDKEGVISYNIKTQEYKTSHKEVSRVHMYVENLLWRELLPSTA